MNTMNKTSMLQLWAPLATSAVLVAPHLSQMHVAGTLAFVAALVLWDVRLSKAATYSQAQTSNSNVTSTNKPRRPLRVVSRWSELETQPPQPHQDLPIHPSGAPVRQTIGTVWLPRAGKWRAQLYMGRNELTGAHSTKNLGQFDTEEEAARVYDAALQEHGFANRRRNFPKDETDVSDGPHVPIAEPESAPPAKRPPGRPRGKFGPGARKAIKLSRDLGIKEGIAIGLARARAANVGSARHV